MLSFIDYGGERNIYSRKFTASVDANLSPAELL